MLSSRRCFQTRCLAVTPDLGGVPQQVPGLLTEVRRARFGPGLWPGPCRQARWAGRGLQGQRRAAGASRVAGCEAPLRLEGPARTMRGVPARSLWHSPGDRRTRREGDGLVVPLAARRHSAQYGLAPDGRLFRGENGGVLVPTSYRSVWQQARLVGLTPRRPPHHWHSVRMIFATATSRCGSTRASRRPRSPNGPGTASKCSSPSMPNAFMAAIRSGTR